MPPKRRSGNPGLTAAQSVRRGLRMDEGIVQFEFKPTIGISARAIDRLGLDIRSFREPLKRVVQKVMAPSFQKNFAEGGRPDAWQPLSESTLEIREKMGKGGRGILDSKGALKRVAGQLNIWTITQETATVRDLPERVWYGKLHQEGYGGSGGSKNMGSRLKAAGGDAKKALRDLDDDLIDAMRTGKKVPGAGRGGSMIPARPFILIQEDDYDDVERIFVDWLQERATANGFIPGVSLG